MRCLALLLLTAGWGVPLAFPHVADDDLLCAVPAAEQDGSASRLDTDQVRQADHCAVCHALRSFRLARVTAAGDPAAPESGPPVRFDGLRQPRQLAFAQVPARAPPA